MKNLLPLITTLLLCMYSINTIGQNIDSIAVYPKGAIMPFDTIRIHIHTTFPSANCNGKLTYGQSGFKINASSLHCLGPLTIICHHVDTIELYPPHSSGTYTFAYELNSGFGTPCTPGIVPNDFDTAYFSVIHLPPVNTPPIITTISDDTICKNDTTYSISFNVTDEALHTCTISATSDNQALIKDTNISIVGVSSIRYLKLKPELNSVGIANIKVLIEDIANQKDSSIFKLMVEDCAVGIKELGDVSVNIYPNPTNGILNILMDKKFSRVQLSIIDILGKEVFATKYSDVATITLDPELPSGIYYLKIGLDQTQLIKPVVISNSK